MGWNDVYIYINIKNNKNMIMWDKLQGDSLINTETKQYFAIQ